MTLEPNSAGTSASSLSTQVPGQPPQARAAEPKAKLRCAIYCRKSSEEGLEQDFNSLDAQHEACAAYITSQKSEGWRLVNKLYQDGGVSGGTLKRPGLTALLDDLANGKIDLIVVYKVDRLTRSLADFAKLVDQMEAHGARFVSVTQSFNTTTSMGRLTLNMLLSFAQFEREVTAERIRDKIAASKQRGLWMGGYVPLGYDTHPDSTQRTLVVNSAEAKTVTRLFVLYEELGQLSKVEQAAAAEGLTSKFRPHVKGKARGGTAFTRGAIHKLLTNPLYIGQIRHKDRCFDGKHSALISQELWDHVQAKLMSAGTKRRGHRADPGLKAPIGSALNSKLFDQTGEPLTPSHCNKNGRRYHYYISRRLIKSGKDPAGLRLPAGKLESALRDQVTTAIQNASASGALFQSTDIHELISQRHRIDALLTQATVSTKTAGSTKASQFDPLKLIERCEFGARTVALKISTSALAAVSEIAEDEFSPAELQFTCPWQLRRCGIEMKLVVGEHEPGPNFVLINALKAAHFWCAEIKGGALISEIARTEGCSESFIRTRLSLAFLSPKIQRLILDGRQPEDLDLESLVRSKIPADFAEQEALFGIQ